MSAPPTMSKPPWYRRKWLAVAAVATVATLTGVRIGVTIWGRSHLAKFVQESQPIWDSERARLEGMKNPLDPSVKDACAPAYKAAGVDLGAATRPVGMALLGDPAAPIPDDARTIVKQEKGAVDGFLRAARCGVYTPRANEAWTTYERLFPFFNSGRLVIVDARIRADAGDVDAALERLLAVVKAGTDLGTGSLMAGVHGAAVSSPALKTIASLLSQGRLSPEQMDRVAKHLELFAPRMPSVIDGVIKERLRLHAIAVHVATTGKAPPEATPAADDPGRLAAAVMPVHAVLADALSRQERFLAEVQTFATEYRDPLEFVIHVANAEPRTVTRRLTAMDFPPYGLMQKGHNLCVPRAWARMLLAAITIERAGAAPKTLPPMEDPCGAGPIIYFTTPDGAYTFESVGKDGAISEDDLYLTHKPQKQEDPAPAP